MGMEMFKNEVEIMLAEIVAINAAALETIERIEYNVQMPDVELAKGGVRS